MEVARATSSPILNSMRRSTPAAGLGIQSSFEAWTITGWVRSSLMRMVGLPHGQHHPELHVTGLHPLIGLGCLLQWHGLDQGPHARQDAEVQRPLVLVGRSGDRSDHASLADDKMACG